MNELHGAEAGTGPTLVVLHGLFGSLDNFHSIASQLEEHFTTLRLDLPAHGRSDASFGDLSFASQSDAVLHTLKTRGIERFFLLGHSLGGKVAMAMGSHCSADPDAPTLLGLIVVDIAPRLYPPHHRTIIDALKALPLDEVRSRREADEHLARDIDEADVRAFILKSLYRKDDTGHAWRFDLDAIDRDYELMRHVPPIDEPITAPTLFIKGEQSDYIDASDEPAIRRLCPSLHFKQIGGAGHWPHAQKPGVFTRICLDFLLPLKESLD